MLGPRDFTPAELARYELAVIQRRPKSGEAVFRVYCLRCGRQVDVERREANPEGWWACARGCNTTYSGAGSAARPLPPARLA